METKKIFYYPKDIEDRIEIEKKIKNRGVKILGSGTLLATGRRDIEVSGGDVEKAREVLDGIGIRCEIR